MLICKQSSYLNHILLKHCKSIRQVHQVHAQVITRGLLSLQPSLLLTNILHSFTSLLPPVTPSSPLLHHYATAIFNTLKNPSSFCYNTIIRAHVLCSLPFHGLRFFVQMRRLSVPPDSHTFPFALKACAQVQSVSLSQTLHSQSLKFGFSADVYVLNCLIHLYSSMGLNSDAHKVFDESPQRDVVSYNTLIDMFVKAGDNKRAQEVFEQMAVRDSVSWGTLISGYAKANKFHKAIELYDQMADLGIRPDNIALVSVLSACAQLGKLQKGKHVHKYC